MTTHATEHNASGFTVVEIVVTLVLTAIFLTLFFQMYMIMEWRRIAVARHATASDIAYSNLRKFVARPTVTCDAAKMDLTASDASSKPGLVLGDETNNPTPSAYGFVAEPSSVTQPLGANVKQTVKAFAPKGCDTTAFSASPIKVESTVSYGTNNERVTHAIFLN